MVAECRKGRCARVASGPGGILADRTGQRDMVIVLSAVSFAITLTFAAMPGAPVWTFALMGAVSGLAAGPIMSLPSLVLSPGNRAVGMGLFFTIYYAVMAVATLTAGALSHYSGSASAAFLLGAGMQVLQILMLFVFRVLTARPATVPA